MQPCGRRSRAWKGTGTDMNGKRSNLKVMASLIGLVKPLTGYMLLAILMGLIGHLCAAFLTVLAGYGLLQLLGIGQMSLGMIFLAMGGCALVRGVLRYAEQSCNHYIAFKLLALIRDKVFKALRRLCPAKLEGKDKGNLIAVITSDIELLEVFYAHTISPIAIALLFTIIMCAYIGSFHWLLGLVALAAYFMVGVIIPVLISHANGDNGMQLRSNSGELSSFVLDSLRGLGETIQYGQGAARLDRMNKKTDILSVKEEQMKRIAGRNQALTNTVILFWDIVMLCVALTLYGQLRVDLDGIWLPVLALMSSYGPVVALAGLGSTLQNTFAAGNRVLDILEESPLVEEIEGQPAVSFDGAAAKSVTFAYDGETVLKDVSVEIPKNHIIGLTGRSGSGKSTLLKLFMRFWEAGQGELCISDKNVNRINTANLRDMESFMTQETHFFHDTIAGNLRIAKLDATQEELEAACRKASVHDFILSLPQGYETQVGELGDTLSGGERQRLGLARAFLHDAPFMLLDEPTSNLDSLNEAVILKSLRDERQGRTVVLVSHRQSTMRIVDTVYSVENGRMS